MPRASDGTTLSVGADSGASRLSIADGPISSPSATPSRASARTPSAKRTGSRRCRTQNSASSIVPAGRTAPVRLQTIGTRSGCIATSASAARNASSIGSIAGEWNAADTGNGRAAIPAASSRRTVSASAAASPATESCAGPLSTAIAAPRARCGATASRPAATATMPPGRADVAASRPRSAATRIAASNDSAPAATAAA
ncbi:putative polyketide synthase [Burkholderia pseudomallei]|nr:putative polyketide synthase [Burkholderia pseudomallei]KGD33212.1 putative polyketide synthase [Burkholderia pseudomallei]KGD34573.1 putative non-ribosomal peptide synthase/polyketide synthase [Burkholderia pseudomallei]KGD49967.1 putative polyketide synthase [Burkholderia pseudomallei]KGD57576.1 putative type I polyketide synthase [Burkholderia pseudomallei]